MFRNQLEDNLKTAKSLEKSSKELKSTPKTAPKQITKNFKGPLRQQNYRRSAGTKRDHSVSATWVIENGQPKRHTHLEGDTPKPSEYSSWWIERVQKRMGESDNRLYYLVLGPRYKIPFTSQLFQKTQPREPQWSLTERTQISSQIKQLLEKGAKCQSVKDQFISSTLDLKDTYYAIPIVEPNKKYLRFIFEASLFEFNCLPFGLNIAPYVFTKLMKPVVTHLRKKGYTSVIYLDDLFLIEKSDRLVQKTRQKQSRY